jgi:hypothetical protein
MSWSQAQMKDMMREILLDIKKILERLDEQKKKEAEISFVVTPPKVEEVEVHEEPISIVDSKPKEEIDKKVEIEQHTRSTYRNVQERIKRVQEMRASKIRRREERKAAMTPEMRAEKKRIFLERMEQGRLKSKESKGVPIV